VKIIESRTTTSSTINDKDKGKVVPVTAMVSRGIAPLILNVGCRWSLKVSSMSVPLYLSGMNTGAH